VECAPLVAADFEAWLPLWQGYLAFYQAKVAEATTQQTFARLTGGSEPMGGFIARDPTGRAVGVVHYILHRSCWTIGDYCYLQDLFVAPDARMSGFGRRLIESVYAEARTRGCSRVWWLTHESNAQGMKLYDRIADRSGFVQYRKLL
jgi:GNAT superfamily N-acetyltransferase